MDIIKSNATDDTVPFRTRESQGAVPTLAPICVPVQGISVPAAGLGGAAGSGVNFRADAASDLTMGDRSASFLASPL